MFTGIIQHVGSIRSIDRSDFGAALVVDATGWAHIPAHGESIAVNGCCLTIADAGDGEPKNGPLRFDLIRQTLETTTLHRLRRGDKVNLEHSVTPQTLLGGHIVQGHVDGEGTVVMAQKSEREHRLRIEVPDPLIDYIVAKGSIAVDGVSLTVAAVGGDWLEVALVPTTLHLTTLGRLDQGSKVNLEADYVAKIVVNWLRHRGQGP
jgi:riboflavin synthase